jgi:DNA-binding transcriptional ArsR family regulator
MTSTPTFAATAALFGHPVRAAILSVLLDGRALPAGELAYAGGVNPATASSHLGKLLDGGILPSRSRDDIATIGSPGRISPRPSRAFWQ